MERSPPLSLIVAMSKNRCIGLNNALPWHLAADLQRFKKLTLGHTVIMGRSTYESIGRPLPNRNNIVLSRQPELKIPGCRVFSSLSAALESIDRHGEIFVIGGAQLFAEALPLAHVFYLTEVDACIEGDVFFPEWDNKKWKERSRESQAADAANDYAMTFIKYERVR